MTQTPIDTLIRGGTIVNAAGEIAADVAIQNGKIVAIGADIEGGGAAEIDATGLHIFAGGIDPHVHFNEPGRADWEGLETGTRALAKGGVTAFCDMPLNSDPPLVDVAQFDAKMAVIREKSRVNAYLWGGLIPGNSGELEALHRRGVIGFKAFMSNSGIAEFPAADDYTLLEGMKIAADLGTLVAVHAENDGITAALSQRAIAEGRVSARDYLDSRPVVAELEAISRVIVYAEATGCKLHIVHVSSGRGVEMVAEAQARGVDVTCETCAHYLAFTDADVIQLGAVAKCAPPIRSHAEQDALWGHVATGAIPMVTSDHSPAPMAMKHGENFFAIWGGIAGCQSTLSVLITEGHHRRGLPLTQIAAVFSANAAVRFGLKDKGSVAIGADADITLVDTESSWILKPEDLEYRHKISPYIGMEFRGRVLRTLRGGKTIYPF